MRSRVPVTVAGVYNGSDFPFDLTDLRALDTALANACLDSLNYDRPGRREVHRHLSKWRYGAAAVDRRLQPAAARDTARLIAHGQQGEAVDRVRVCAPGRRHHR